MKKNYIIIKFVFIIIFFVSFNALSKDVEILNKQSGTGNKIINHSKVKVHYKGMLEDGTVFDSSYKRKEPFTFQIGIRQVIEGWEKGLIGLKEGAKLTLVIPPELAYSDKGAGELIPPNSKLIFDIEILEVKLPGYKTIKPSELEQKQKKGFVVIDIRSKDEINKTGSIEGAIKLTAFNKSGQLNKKFLKSYQSLVTNTDNVILVSKNGDISSILANGFTEYLGAKNMYSLEGGIQAYIKFKSN
tara:strand:+ start:51 stop:782 length:732 start_codon:yes stop_codon:yes gene_type:complete